MSHTHPGYLLRGQKAQVGRSEAIFSIIRLDCSDNEDTARQKQQIYGSGNMLTTYFRHCGKDVKLKLFKTYCHNIYDKHLWSEYSKTGYDRIRIAFNDIFHNLLGIKCGDSISAAFVKACMDNFNKFRRKSV